MYNVTDQKFVEKNHQTLERPFYLFFPPYIVGRFCEISSQDYRVYAINNIFFSYKPKN